MPGLFAPTPNRLAAGLPPLTFGFDLSSSQTRTNLTPELLHPVRNEDIGLVRLFTIAVRRPHQLFAIGGEHGERIEVGIKSNPLLMGAVCIDDIEIEIAAVFGVSLIGGKDDALAVGMEERSEIGRAVVGNLRFVFAVGV